MLGTLKKIGQPFDVLIGIYALTSLLFFDTYYSVSKIQIINDWDINPKAMIWLLSSYFFFLHLFPFLGRIVIGVMKLGISQLSLWVFKKDPFEYGWFPKQSREDGYYSVHLIRDLYHSTGKSFLGDLIEKSQLEEKKFRYNQNTAFSLAVLLIANLYTKGIVMDITEYFGVNINCAYFFWGIVSLLLILYSTSTSKEFLIQISRSNYANLCDNEKPK